MVEPSLIKFSQLHCITLSDSVLINLCFIINVVSLATKLRDVQEGHTRKEISKSERPGSHGLPKQTGTSSTDI